jgi:hypothetical protein
MGVLARSVVCMGKFAHFTTITKKIESCVRSVMIDIVPCFLRMERECFLKQRQHERSDF